MTRHEFYVSLLFALDGERRYCLEQMNHFCGEPCYKIRWRKRMYRCEAGIDWLCDKINVMSRRTVNAYRTSRVDRADFIAREKASAYDQLMSRDSWGLTCFDHFNGMIDQLQAENATNKVFTDNLEGEANRLRNVLNRVYAERDTALDENAVLRTKLDGLEQDKRGDAHNYGKMRDLLFWFANNQIDWATVDKLSELLMEKLAKKGFEPVTPGIAKICALLVTKKEPIEAIRQLRHYYGTNVMNLALAKDLIEYIREQ